MIELVARLHDELVESSNGLHDIVVADLVRKSDDPSLEPATDWVVLIRGVEVPVPRGASDDEIRERVCVEIRQQEREYKAGVPTADTRSRRPLTSSLLGTDIEPERV